MSGISIAAPFVSGVAGLMMQNNDGASPDVVRAILANNSIELVRKGKTMCMDLD
ncbi:MAG: hypothetical protein E4H21_11340 [Thermodesulfobacteriales bacterium]|nr:MAG: hypothetical protein E4H21_11340 [Thermodesulfobacteriales bacterium]